MRGGVALGEVGGVGGELVGYDAPLTIFAVGLAELLIGRLVDKHRDTVTAQQRGPDAAGVLVVHWPAGVGVSVLDSPWAVISKSPLGRTSRSARRRCRCGYGRSPARCRW